MDTLFHGLKYKVRGTSEKDSPTYLGLSKYILGLKTDPEKPDPEKNPNKKYIDMRREVERGSDLVSDQSPYLLKDKEMEMEVEVGMEVEMEMNKFVFLLRKL